MSLLNLTYYTVTISLLIKNVSSDGILVKVEQGWLRGEQLDLVTGDGHYYSFKGIPYAAPPVGKLRFKAPQPPVSWKTVRNATEHGSTCLQVELFTRIYTPGDEDCLFINVYSPNLKPCTQLSVLVFIHGGGYKSGSGNVDSYGPDFLVRKNMIVVTFNYRLDALGFLTLGTKHVPGNAGLKDQVAALKWVQANIKQFGGDPNKLTIMGQSAGGASVSLHITSPMSAGLFQRAIVMSGTPNCDWSLAFQAVRRAFVLGRQLGKRTRDPDELLQFLQEVTVDKLVDTIPNVYAFEEYAYDMLKMYQFVPVGEAFNGEDNFMPNKFLENFTHINKVDILFGHTNQETVGDLKALTSSLIKRYDRFPELFVPHNISYKFSLDTITDLSGKIINYYFGNKSIDINSTKEFVTYANYIYKYNILRYFARLPIIEDTARYFYQFSSVSSRNIYGLKGAEYGIIGAGHTEDLLYLFDPKSQNFTLSTESQEFKLINQITTLFANFAKYGNPTPDSSFNVTWPLFDNMTVKYVDIGNKLTVLSRSDDDSIKFSRNILESVGIYY